MSGIIESVGKIIGATVIIVTLIIGLSMLFAFPTKWLWNWLMPELFALSQISVWQALGLLILSGLLFSSKSSSNNK